MSTVSASPTQHNCSCGRTFLNAISLERHQWVTNHRSAAPAAKQGKDAVAQALKILREKQAVQLEFDVKRRQKRRMRREILKVEQQVYAAAEQAYQSAKSVGHSTLMGARLALMLLVLSGLVVTGMKIGTLLPG
ncbi:hypothetical protein IV102_07580 [bacterium]|nr:hypothetical protein [bacterium]